jgi:5-methyltetrahydropteroyltriglutamate--homocysteine methyltransferase
LTLNLPLTTTIGSFPQTAEVRSWKKFKKENYHNQNDTLIRKETNDRFQEESGIDV